MSNEKETGYEAGIPIGDHSWKLSMSQKTILYAKVFAESPDIPEEAKLALYNMLVEHLHKFKQSKWIVDDRPY